MDSVRALTRHRSTKTNMNAFIFVLICFLGSNVDISVEESTHVGCSKNKQPGDKWVTHEKHNCMQCLCEDGLEVCEDCDGINGPLSLKPDCYLKRAEKKAQTFPACCNNVVQICPSDKHYNKEEMEKFQDQQVLKINKRRK